MNKLLATVKSAAKRRYKGTNTRIWIVVRVSPGATNNAIYKALVINAASKDIVGYGEPQDSAEEALKNLLTFLTTEKKLKASSEDDYDPR